MPPSDDAQAAQAPSDDEAEIVVHRRLLCGSNGEDALYTPSPEY